ncbi:transcription-repair coupling factor [bacterium]|nr:transcription-repair coupling factor [bacterium]
MALSAIRRKIQLTEPFAALRKALSGGRLPEIVGTDGLGSAIVADYLVREMGKTVLWLSSRDIYARFSDAISLLGEERALLFPEWDIEPYEHQHPSEEIVATRLRTMLALRSGEPKLVVATPESLFLRTISPRALDEWTIRLEIGDEITPEKLLDELVSLGYVREDLVEFLGSVSRRGDVVDVFAATQNDPIRIEFFGDEIESIRTFSAENQRSRAKLRSVAIPPAVEWVKNFWRLRDPDIDDLRKEIVPKNRSALRKRSRDRLLSRMLIDYDFPGGLWFSPMFEPEPRWPEEHFPRDSIVLCEEPEELFAAADEMRKKAESYQLELKHDKEIHLDPAILFPDSEAVEKRLSACNTLSVRSFPTTEDAIDMGFRAVASSYDGPVAFRRGLDRFRSDGYDINLLCQDDFQIKRLSALLPEAESVPSNIASISAGFLHRPSREAVITGWTIFGRRRRKTPPKRYREGSAYALPTGLSQGDLVVHADHGIGRFLGTEIVESGGFSAECLVVQYADDERLFVPIADFHLVQKYLGGEDVKLARLGGSAWAKAKNRAQRSIMALAGELVQLYALRKVTKGVAYPEEDELSAALAESFPFDETDDQLDAIADVVSDMERDRPMDRLLVGDVGFGKTEVAIRAAFKAVRGGEQVAVLVPTTVLAEQHFRTFTARLADLPVRIDMLSRFRSKKQQRKTIAGLSDGTIDVVIGTHRLLSSDVHFKNLGLLIIDKEQQFGVKHKERIKKWRARIDVLTMTATPIPRTMSMALSGVRDMSIIETPPANRLPIYTRVVPFSGDTIAESIEREVARGGQVYFLHNRVGSIEAMAHYLRSLVPNARFAVAHGQMKEGELSEIMMDFLAGRFDVLVTTTIIESGTDIPNVNTIIINRADRFGVAQLYQLRGRVGRSDQQAYCYLIAPPYKKIPIKAKKRLKALLDHSDLGSGFALAMRDLEIRGAGNLLGAQQHGFVEEIGLELYSRMLSEAVATLKGEAPPHLVPVDTQVDAQLFIPKTYMPSARMRIEFYQRLYMASTMEKLADLKAEIIDRFGTPPEEVLTLFTYLKMRLAASLVSIPLRDVILKKGRAIFLFANGWVPSLLEIDCAISPLNLKTDFRRNPFELRFELSGKHSSDLVVMRNIAERLSKIKPA